MNAGLLALTVLQISAAAGAQRTPPVLDFPEPGLDDAASYQGYQTRFYRDAKRNTVQIYLEPRSGRVVTLWADGANASIGFTVRDRGGRPVPLSWAADSAEVCDSGAVRTLQYRLRAASPVVDIGGFLLGSMRVERDFQYLGRHLLPLTTPLFRVVEESVLVARLVGLPAGEQDRHLALLRASSVAQVRARLRPTIAWSRGARGRVIRVARRSLDGRNRLALEIATDRRRASVETAGQTVTIRSRSDRSVNITIRVTTDAPALTPLSRDEIFRPSFLDALTAARRASDSASVTRYRRMERQVRGVELLSSREKLMAGLPNFATYFGRDMMMTALMMRSIWIPAMSEHVIASVLRKLGPGGEVSHEEALGGQAIRENAQRYDSLVTGSAEARRAGRRGHADSLMREARAVLANLQATRENYHMIDDELQLPVLAAAYLTDPEVPDAQKRAFLTDTTGGRGSRLALLFAELGLVARQTQPYTAEPRPENLISFPRLDSTRWRSASWRDSDAGYAGGRFAMDVNAIWAPHALEAIDTILAIIRSLDLVAAPTSLGDGASSSILALYSRDAATLRRAVERWRGAARHFAVTLDRDQVRQRIAAKLAWLPEDERRYWELAMRAGGVPDSLRFLALALDSAGAPIPVINTDPATALLLDTGKELDSVGAAVSARDLEPFVIPYPAGLFVSGLGPLVANDAYASREVWERFEKDQYHGPRVVWGREVNLLFLGLARRIAASYDGTGRLRHPSSAPYVRALGSALRRTLGAVRSSGLEHNELWRFRIAGGRLQPVRYGTSSDVQLWNTTDLAVEHALEQLPD